MTITSITTKTAITDPAITPALLPLERSDSSGEVLSPVNESNEQKRIKTRSIHAVRKP